MIYDKGKQLNVGELKKLIEHIPNDTKLYVGVGDNVKPLRYLCEHNGGLMFHTDVYCADAKINNYQTIIKLQGK